MITEITKRIPTPVKDMLRGTWVQNISSRISHPINARYPMGINIELTSRCNAVCKMCPYKMVNRKKRDMDFSLYQNIINQVSSFPSSPPVLTISGLGEPLLYPKLFDAIKYAKLHSPSIKIGFNTNGILLNGDYADRFVSYGLDTLTISLNTNSAESYRWLMGVDKYEQAVTGIREFLEQRRRNDTFKNTGKPYIILQIFDIDINRRDIDNFIECWTPIVGENGRIAIRPLKSWGGDIDVYELYKDYPLQEKYPCRNLWQKLDISVNGQLFPCDQGLKYADNYLDSTLWLGSIDEIPLGKVYGTSNLHRLRACHLRGTYAEIPECKDCNTHTWFRNVWLRNRLPFIRRMWL